MKVPLNRHELINRIWFILAAGIALSYYLFSQDNDWFIVTTFIGGVAIIHTERKADYEGWTDGIVLIAHMLAILAIFGSVTIGAILLTSGLDFNDGLMAIVIFFIASGVTAVAHNTVQDHYKKIREQKR